MMTIRMKNSQKVAKKNVPKTVIKLRINKKGFLKYSRGF